MVSRELDGSSGTTNGLKLTLFFSSLSSRLTVAILLKDDYFVSGAGLPGRFKAEKVEFHWGHSNGSAGSEHSVNGRRFPVEVRELGAAGFPLWAAVSFLWSFCRLNGHSLLSFLRKPCI